MAEESGSQQDSRKDFAQNGGLPQFLHQFAGKLGGSEEDGEGQEHRHHFMLCQMGQAEPVSFWAISASLCLTRAMLYRKRTRYRIFA